jgi:ABC-type multidrug transport system fused ATPase/permease subunit
VPPKTSQTLKWFVGTLQTIWTITMAKVLPISLSHFLRALSSTFGESPGLTTIWCLLVILRALSVPMLIWLTGYIIGMVTSSEPLDTGRCILIAILWLASLTIGSAFSPWISYFQAKIGCAAQKALQMRLINALNSVPDLSMIERKSFHEDLSFSLRELDTIPGYFIGQSAKAFESIVATLALAFIIAKVSWIILIIVLISIVPHLLVTRSLIKHNYWMARLATQEWRETQLCASSITNLSFAKETRLFGCESYFINKSIINFSKLKELLLASKFKSTIYPIPTLLLLQIGSVLSLLVLLHDFRVGVIGSAAIVVILQSLYAFHGQLETALGTYHVFMRYLLTFSAIFRVIEIKPSIVTNTNPLPIGIADGIEVRFDNVCFSYPGGQQVLKNISFTWKQGQNFALVGENGSGKSTIVKLLLRFYDPDSGVIYINNRPIKDYDLGQWRDVIAPVFQDFGRYEYSIMENLYFAKPPENTEDTMEILNRCGLLSLIQSLPDGINTRLGKRLGTTDLSGGQWQKLAIGRALCKPSSMMILDEPTAALDPNTESDIYQLLETLSRGKSTLMITHRLGSTKMADLILVLSENQIVESGTHEELMKAKGIYG